MGFGNICRSTFGKHVLWSGTWLHSPTAAAADLETVVIVMFRVLLLVLETFTWYARVLVA
jgi:hypothetical protein